MENTVSFPTHETVGVIWGTWRGSDHAAELGRLKLMTRLVAIYGPERVKFLSLERAPIASACTSLVEAALRAGCTWIFWVDDDVVVRAGTFERLRECADEVQRPVVSALSFFRYPPFWPSIFKFENWPGLNVPSVCAPLPVTAFPDNELIKVDATGLCATLIHASVFRKLPKPWFDYSSTGTPDGHFMAGLWKAGIPVYCHTGVEVGHLRTEAVTRAHYRDWVAEHGVEAARSAAVGRWRSHDAAEVYGMKAPAEQPTAPIDSYTEDPVPRY